MPVEIVQVPNLSVMGLTRTGKYEIIPQLMGELFMNVMPRGIAVAGPPIFLCHERSVEEVRRAAEAGTAVVEVAVPIDGQAEGAGGVRKYELAGGEMAKITHKGPYQEIEPTYDELWAWLEKNNRKIAGNIREVYLNDPQKTAPEDLLTEIYAPID